MGSFPKTSRRTPTVAANARSSPKTATLPPSFTATASASAGRGSVAHLGRSGTPSGVGAPVVLRRLRGNFVYSQGRMQFLYIKIATLIDVKFASG